MRNEKMLALALVEVGIVDTSDFNYEVNGGEYLVLTEEERDEKVKEHIEESVWAFNSSFLSSYTGVDEEVFKILSEKCEGANDAILSLINNAGSLQSFVDEAVAADGYGHFLSPYDGNEEEIVINGTTYYIYRTN